MKTVHAVKEAHDLELFAREIEGWQENRRRRMGTRYPDNLIYFSRPCMDKPRKEMPEDTLSGPLKFAMGFAAAVLLLGLLALIV